MCNKLLALPGYADMNSSCNNASNRLLSINKQRMSITSLAQVKWHIEYAANQNTAVTMQVNAAWGENAILHNNSTTEVAFEELSMWITE
jgi:hypothetical protein